MTAPAMWQRFRYLEHEVEVIQQWGDPFGRRMIRVASTAPGDEVATGMPEDAFLADAVPVDPSTPTAAQ